MAKSKQTYEIAVGLKKGHKVTKNERKKPRPSQMKGVSFPPLPPSDSSRYKFTGY